MGDTDPAIPLCVFCGAPWGEAMIDGLYISKGCETCGFGAGAEGTIMIYCSACERLVYQKEFSAER